MAVKRETVSPQLERRIEKEKREQSYRDFSCHDDMTIRRIDCAHDKATVIRPACVRDVDKILYSPYYNRYMDKTQVISLHRNDDISRRGLHVQLVSRIARTIGAALNLNCDLIEAIALGHDIGHAPFGHRGEEFLDELLFRHTGRHFSHNIHSVRVLDQIFPLNLTLQTLSGIAGHNGELASETYSPEPLSDFQTFDAQIEHCCKDKNCLKQLAPSTLEGCVVRVSDIIAYLGKDRADAMCAGILHEDVFEPGVIGTINTEIMNNLMVNIIENSYGKPYICMDKAHFAAMQKAKADNYRMIYLQPSVQEYIDGGIKPMMQYLYERLLHDLEVKNTQSPIYSHHIHAINASKYRRGMRPYEEMTEPNQIVTDYIASMTDDYFVELFQHMSNSTMVKYKGRFDSPG